MPTGFLFQPDVESQAQDGNGKVIKRAVCTFWTHRDGDPDKAQVTGLTELDGSPIADDTLVCDDNGFLPRPFYAPVPAMWIDGGAGALVLIQTTDTPGRVADLADAQGLLDTRITANEQKLSAVDVDSITDLQTAVAGKIDKGTTVVLATDHGVKADGITDDTAALNAALTAAQGRLLLMPGGTVRIDSQVTIPSDVTVQWRGTTLSAPVGTAFAVQVTGSHVVFLDELHVDVDSGPDCRGVQISGSDLNLAAVKVTSPDPGTGSSVNLNDGVRINDCSQVTIDRLTVTNFDFAAALRTVTGVTIGRVTITGYRRGLYVIDSKQVAADAGSIAVASPNAIYDAGHNGVLLDATANYATDGVYLDRLVVEDAGEHGFRIGSEFVIRDVHHRACVARNVGGSGFKALGQNGNRHEDIYYADCVAEDCGQVENNQDGFQIQQVFGGALTNPVVRMRNKPGSAYIGVRVTSCERLTVVNPTVSDTISHGVLLDGALGDMTNVAVRGGTVRTTGSDSLHIDYTGVTFRRVGVYGHMLCEGAAGYGVQIINGGGGVATRGVVECEIWFPALGAANGNLGFYVANMIGEFADVNFANGSLWQDYTNQVVKAKAAGTWAQV